MIYLFIIIMHFFFGSLYLQLNYVLDVVFVLYITLDKSLQKNP